MQNKVWFRELLESCSSGNSSAKGFGSLELLDKDGGLIELLGYGGNLGIRGDSHVTQVNDGDQPFWMQSGLAKEEWTGWTAAGAA